MTEKQKSPVQLKTLEDLFGFLALLLLALIPFAKAVARIAFRSGFQASDSFIVHLVLLITFLGGMISSRENRHLAISVGLEAVPVKFRAALATAASLLSSVFCFAFAWSSLSFVLLSFEADMRVGFVPLRLIGLIMPLGFTVMGVRAAANSPGRFRWITGSLSILLGTLLAWQSLATLGFLILPEAPVFLMDSQDIWYEVMRSAATPLTVLLIISAFAGTPLFVVLGGIAFLLFARAGGVPEVIPNEAYTLLTGNTIAAIPLFTLAGFVLSESAAGTRLVTLFRTLFGWMPGGMVIVAVLVSAFFTTFTGASGVTILALGGLLSYVLVESGRYSGSYSTGLLTASGSIGILFPPSLPIILYGVAAGVNIMELFAGGILPGLLMVTAMSLTGVISTIRKRTHSVQFKPQVAMSAIRQSLWEILLPVLIVVLYFSGLTTLVETAAVSVLYALGVELLVMREVPPAELVRKVAVKSLPILGGVLIILALAKGLSYYIVDSQAPVALSEWVSAHIQSKYVFLILLNLILLLTGCLMDIFSAIIVVVPLILPLGEAFGIHPVHLGIIFIANLEVGFITPPVGLNLFLASYRFSRPLLRLYRDVLPFFLIQIIIVLIITYLPVLSTALLPLVPD